MEKKSSRTFPLFPPPLLPFRFSSLPFLIALLNNYAGRISAYSFQPFPGVPSRAMLPWNAAERSLSQPQKIKLRPGGRIFAKMLSFVYFCFRRPALCRGVPARETDSRTFAAARAVVQGSDKITFPGRDIMLCSTIRRPRASARRLAKLLLDAAPLLSAATSPSVISGHFWKA